MLRRSTRRLDVEPLECAELREAVLADRPARVEEAPAPAPRHVLGVEPGAKSLGDLVRLVAVGVDSAAEVGVLLERRSAALAASSHV